MEEDDIDSIINEDKGLPNDNKEELLDKDEEDDLIIPSPFIYVAKGKIRVHLRMNIKKVTLRMKKKRF